MTYANTCNTYLTMFYVISLPITGNIMNIITVLIIIFVIDVQWKRMVYALQRLLMPTC